MIEFPILVVLLLFFSIPGDFTLSAHSSADRSEIRLQLIFLHQISALNYFSLLKYVADTSKNSAICFQLSGL